MKGISSEKIDYELDLMIERWRQEDELSKRKLERRLKEIEWNSKVKEAELAAYMVALAIVTPWTIFAAEVRAMPVPEPRPWWQFWN